MRPLFIFILGLVLYCAGVAGIISMKPDLKPKQSSNKQGPSTLSETTRQCLQNQKLPLVQYDLWGNPVKIICIRF